MNYQDWLNLMEPELKSMYSKFNSIVIPEPEPDWKYEQLAGAHIVTIKPEKLKIHAGPVRGNYVPFSNYVNASFVWWENYPLNTKPYPTSMVIYNGEIINNSQPNGFWSGTYVGKGVPTPTFIIYKNGAVTVKDTNDLAKEASNIHIAVTIVETNPVIRTQGYVPYVTWSSLSYTTNRVGIYYRRKDNKILLVYRSNTNIEDFHSLAKELEVDLGGCLDSGGSANFKVNNQNINTTNRWMYAGFTWEV